jgi:transcriptional regulator with XRE-family HTH domain
MNRLLYVARKAKGLTEKQVAKVLQIEESEYKELEHSLTDVTAKQALLLAKFYNIEAEQFIYTDGRKERVLKYAMDEISRYKQDGLLENLPPGYYFNIVTLGNTAFTLQAELSHSIYRQYELEQDNQALRLLYEELKKNGESKG